MDPIITGAAVSGILGIGGGLLGNKASADEAARNRQFQKRMYRHRYQYTVEDMRKAGLNPALAYQQGGGSAPSGSMAQQEDVLGKGIEAAGRGVGTALAVRQNQANVEQTKAQTRLTNAQAAQLEAESSARAEWWQARPERERTATLESGMRWRIGNLTREFLDQTMQDRISIVGLDRESAEQALVQLRQEIELRGLDRAPLEAQAAFARSWFGQNVAPAIGSAQGIAGILTGLVAPFLRWMEEKGRTGRDARVRGEVETKRTWKGGSSTTRRRY